jgi:hypothetical protein
LEEGEMAVPATPVYGSDFPTPVFELSADIEHNLAALRAAIEGKPEQLIVPEGNHLDVNRAELERAFPGHQMFMNLGVLLASLTGGPSPKGGQEGVGSGSVTPGRRSAAEHRIGTTRHVADQM